MAERTRATSRFFPFPLAHATPSAPDRTIRPGELPIQSREPPARSVGGLLESLLAQGLAEPVIQVPPATERVDEADRIEARLRALAAQESPAFLRAGGAVLRGRMAPTYSDGPYPLRFVFGQPIPDGPFELDVEGYNSIYRFEVRRFVRVGDQVAVPAPDHLLRLQHRRVRRAVTPAGFTAAFRHPVLPELEIRRSVRDVSRNGLCFEIRPDQDILAPGLKIRDLVVTTPAGATLQFDATVRILHPPRDGRGAAAGVRLTPSSAGDAARWEQLVGGLLNPATQLGATWSEDSWDLYTASGYFSLSGKSQPHFALLKAPFATATRKVDAAPELGCQVSWPSDRGIEASISLLKIYTHTWFGFQMAKLPGNPLDGTPGRNLLRDIHLRAYEHAQADPDLKWVMGLVQESAKWSKLVHHDLPARYVDSGLACLHPFHALEIDTLDVRAQRPRGVEVGAPTEEELGLFLEHVARNRPWAYREALDLVPDRLALGHLRDRWSGAGLTRERDLLVLRRDGRPLAMALVESADQGLHLFNLLDVVRLYALAPDGVDAFSPLLDAASAWFRARGRSAFTCLLEDGSPRCAAGLSVRDLGRGSLTLLSEELLPNLLEHVHEVTAPRLPRG